MPDECTGPSLRLALPARLARWAEQIESACAQCGGLDPFLLVAIMDRESLGGEALSPPGPTGTGDNGHGRGLMQIDDRAFADWCAKVGQDGAPLWQDPAQNILMGAEVLLSAMESFDFEYAPSVAAYNAGEKRVRAALASLQSSRAADRLAAVDAVTTGGNYASDVLRRRNNFLNQPGDLHA